MALRKKLYYDVTVSPAPGGPFVSIPGWSARNILPIYFVDGGLPLRPDRYGNLMDPNRYTGASGNAARCRQAIGAWIEQGSGGSGASICIDFVEASAPTVPIPDPAAVRRPAVRVKVGTPPNALLQATLYVQRQHSIEV